MGTRLRILTFRKDKIMSLEINEQKQNAIAPIPEIKNLGKYEETIYHDAYSIGRATGMMTLDAKNQHKILSNLVWVIFDDAINKNKQIDSKIIKNSREIIQNAFDILRNINFVIDEKRAAAIIEGYGDIIEEKNRK